MRQKRHSSLGLHDWFAWAIVLLPVMIDYKGPAGSSVFTALYATITVAHLLAVSYFLVKYGIPRSRTALYACIVSGVFVFTSVTSSVTLDHKAEDIIRGIVPIMMFFSTIACVGSISNSTRNPLEFWTPTVAAACFGTFVNVVLVLTLQGFNPSTIRYQILGGFTPLILSLTVAAIVYGGVRSWALISILVNAFLVLFSVTRTQIAVALAVSGSLIVFAGTNLARAPQVWKNMGLAAVALAAFVAVAATLPGAPLERWAARLMITDESSRRVDITAVARKAQTDYQLEMMSSRPVQALLGFGVATESGFTSSGAAIIYELLGYEEAAYRDDGVGHNNYIGSMFVGGVIAGGAMILFHLYALILAANGIRRSSRVPAASTYLEISAPLCVVAYMTFGFLGGTFGSRSASICLAVAIGVTIWQTSEAARRVATPARPLTPASV